jgi:hypothetical protein
MAIVVELRGPVFDGRAQNDLALMALAIETEVGRQAYAMVMGNLNASIRHPTPYYETQVIVQHLEPSTVVHDRGIIYGPWLEGVGSRNKTTRFKGYSSFRRAFQSLIPRIKDLAEHALGPWLGRLNG